MKLREKLTKLKAKNYKLSFMIAIDIEATGTEHHLHSIVSLGALDVFDPDNRFYEECRVWEGAHINDEALNVNGFTLEEVTDKSKQTEAELVEKFVVWASSLRDQTFLGQNVSLDRDFVKSAIYRSHKEYPFAHRTLDTHTLAYMHMTQRGIEIPIAKNHSAINLDAILTYCGIPEEPQPHNALTGALCHAEVASRLLYDKKLLPEFTQFEIPWLRA